MPTSAPPMSHAFFRYYALAWLFLALLVTGLLLVGVGPKDFLLSESGPIELGSALGYLLCAVAAVWLAPARSGRWHGAVLLVFFAMRELDLHNRFTTMSLLKSKFYLSPEVPMPEKLVGVAVVGLFLYAAYRLFRQEGRAWLADLRHGRACAYGMLFALVCMGVSKSLDGLARKLADVGFQISAQASSLASTFEEILEFGIPLMIGLGIACYYRHGREQA